MSLMTAAIVQPDPSATDPWWKGAAIYQIYPRSFADANGDGIGDLAGITAHLDHVAKLGMDAVWLSPFFTSPMKDFGYDVADYRDVDPIFGTLANFDALVERAHALGLRIIIDQVYSHTSNEHPWFEASRASRSGDKADWYVWADAKPDGSPPSNWQSVFGGPAWTWDARRQQYYLHNFLKEQPQLNGHNPAVQAELLETARFWLDRGVDGFRLDAINFAMHDPALTDNPPAPATNRARTRPFDFQLKLHNQGHADIPAFLERIRALLDSHGTGFTVAEIGGEDSDREMKLFTADGKRLDSAYSFDFLYADVLTPHLVADSLARWPNDPKIGWPSWAFENHDAPRAVSRWTSPDHARAFARMKLLLLACLRGNIFLYQGEELGLTQVDIAFEDLLDPEAIANWPMTLSRDGARTPMPWVGSARDLGFGSETPWLPFGSDHAALAIDVQDADDGSLLNWTRRVLMTRRAQHALRGGDLHLRHVDDAVLAFEREAAGERLLCVFNFGDTPRAWPEALPRPGTTVIGTHDAGDVLPPFAAMVVQR